MKQNKQLNISRLELIQKGYVNQKELAVFLDVGKKKAKVVYDNITADINHSGKNVDVLGIPTYRALDYIGLTEDDIRRFANDEKRMWKNNDS